MDDHDSQEATTWTIRQKNAMAALLAIIFLFQVVMLRRGNDWGGDFAMYLNQARNVVNFHDMSDTGYVYNPDAPVIGPRVYPPLYSVFLAPIYAIFGADYQVLKIAMVVLMVGTLTLCAGLFSRQLTPGYTFALIALIGFCPIFWKFNHDIISEHLFVLFWMLAMWLYERERENTEQPTDRFGSAVLMGLVVYLAIGTRTVGIVLPPALILTELIRYRRITRYMLVSVGSAVIFYVVQKLLLPSGGSGYMDQVSQISVDTILYNLYADGGSFTHVWDNNIEIRNAEKVARLSGIFFSLIAIYGALRANAARFQFLFVASILYFILIVIWPGASWDRMIWPLYPGFIAWLLYAFQSLSWSQNVRTALVVPMLLYTFGCYGVYYINSDYSRIPGPEDATAQEMFSEVDRRLAKDEVCLFFKPRVMAFYLRRPSIGYPIDLTEASLERTIHDHDVHLAVTRSEDEPEVPELLAKEGFTQVWSNAEFQIWLPATEPPLP
ncbi:ArnT family glycosyltransferase [Blastopirellula marina]|uniref:Glycosyltransferase RgtA/B/C/D-like domain-containing protein n=1 Tax=Blastopirellula marina TaxID=124 RepID=A0A2S8GLZ1_9BACT|nr:glycosyltransferase family 39 protein [Blastopirellula marina]PQO45456.1 hypothetical protein C5Y93_13475 [Blastopirellula marina]